MSTQPHASCRGDALNLHEGLGIATAPLHVGRQNGERDGLHVGQRFLPGAAVCERAGQVGDLGDPAAVCLAIKVHSQLHDHQV
jgi:hypothetical protein